MFTSTPETLAAVILILNFTFKAAFLFLIFSFLHKRSFNFSFFYLFFFIVFRLWNKGYDFLTMGITSFLIFASILVACIITDVVIHNIKKKEETKA